LFANEARFQLFLFEPKAGGQCHRRIEDTDSITSTGRTVCTALTLLNAAPDFVVVTAILAAVFINRHNQKSERNGKASSVRREA
jgi:hypothetical protein